MIAHDLKLQQLMLQLKLFGDNPSVTIDSEYNGFSLKQRLEKMADRRLFQLAQLSPEYSKLLSSRFFSDFWDACIQSIRLVLPANPQFKFMPNPSQPSFELFLGIMNFFLQTPAAVADLNLTPSLAVNSYYALQESTDRLIRAMNKDKSNNLAMIDKQLSLYQSQAIRHGTPVYILLANLYFIAAMNYQSLDRELETVAAFLEVIKYLTAAKKLEKNFKPAIHNAYYGKGYVVGNTFSLTSIEEMQIKCLRTAASYLKPFEIDLARQRGLSVAPLCSVIPITYRRGIFSKDEMIVMEEDTSAISSLTDYEARNKWGETLLLFATRHGKAKIVNCLIALGASTTAQDNDGNTALHLALYSDNIEICRLLIKRDKQLIMATNNMAINCQMILKRKMPGLLISLQETETKPLPISNPSKSDPIKRVNEPVTSVTQTKVGFFQGLVPSKIAQLFSRKQIHEGPHSI